MDSELSVSHVQRGNTNVHDLPARAAITIKDLKPFEVKSLDQVKEILERYNALKVPREHIELFKMRLTSDLNSWFVDAGGVGLIYLTNIQPEFGAELKVIFWDGGLAKDRQEAIKTVVATGFELFALPRVSMHIPVTNIPLRKIIARLGFVLEGVTRNGIRMGSGEYQDIIQYGMLKEEIPPCLLMKISSEPLT